MTATRGLIATNRSEHQVNIENSLKFQLRLGASAELAARLRGDPSCKAHGPLHDVLGRHDAFMMCQYDAFAEYVSEAQSLGPEKYPLYRWTKETIENPEKKTKYLETFTVYVKGEAIYEKAVADPLQAELSALVDGVGIKSVVRFDTNPAKNPQPPARSAFE
jgi:hypothetical protein